MIKWLHHTWITDVQGDMREVTDIASGRVDSYDFGARHYDPHLGTWMAPDPMAEKYPGLSPFVYCHNDPINRFDNNGEWDISVSAAEDRINHSYAILTVTDKSGIVVYKTVVRVLGLKGVSSRLQTGGPTPTGKYKIRGWARTGSNTPYDIERYGPNDLLQLDYYEGEAAGLRSGILLHGGRPQEDHLWNTKGCIRINNDDIADIKRIVTALELDDSEEKAGVLTVVNDLIQHIEYRDREEIKQFIPSVNGGELSPAIISENAPSQQNNLHEYFLQQFYSLPSGTIVYYH